MNLKLVAVDCGKANTKVYMYDPRTSKTDKAIIPTNVTTVNNLVLASGDDSQFVVNIGIDDEEIKGKWMIGGVGGESSYSNSKKDRIHKIMTLVAIALVTENGDEVIPAIGCPVSIFDNEEERAAFYKYLLPEGRVDININGSDKYFYIAKDRGLNFPESYGALFLFQERFTDQTGIVDIGGLNVNACYFDGLKPEPKLCTTEKLGCAAIVESLRKRLNAACDANYNDRRVLSFLKSGSVPNFKEGKKIIEEEFERHVDEIDGVLKNWDTSRIDLIFIGGTTRLLAKYIERKYKDRAYIPEDESFINCKGFLKALIKYAGYNCPF